MIVQPCFEDNLELLAFRSLWFYGLSKCLPLPHSSQSVPTIGKSLRKRALFGKYDGSASSTQIPQQLMNPVLKDTIRESTAGLYNFLCFELNFCNWLSVYQSSEKTKQHVNNVHKHPHSVNIKPLVRLSICPCAYTRKRTCIPKITTLNTLFSAPPSAPAHSRINLYLNICIKR